MPPCSAPLNPSPRAGPMGGDEIVPKLPLGKSSSKVDERTQRVLSIGDFPDEPVRLSARVRRPRVSGRGPYQ